MEKETVQAQNLYSSKDMADFLNLTERRVRQLAQQKIIPRAGRGVFDFVPTVKAYIQYLQGVANGALSPESSSLEKRLLAAQVDEREAKARQAKYQADLMEGRLLKLEEVEQQWSARLIEFKAAMLELPRRLAFRFTRVCREIAQAWIAAPDRESPEDNPPALPLDVEAGEDESGEEKGD